MSSSPQMANADSDSRSLPPSEATSWSHITPTSGTPDHARVFVQLNNGIRFMVPVTEASTVYHLHERAIRRAAKFGFSGSLINSVLQTTKAPAVSLCGEDLVVDVLDLTEANSFDLCLLSDSTDRVDLSQHLGYSSSPFAFQNYSTASTTTVASPSFKEQTGLETSFVYIRWITLEDALTHSQLCDIKTDHAPLSQHTALSQLFGIATDKFAGRPSNGSGEQEQKVRLFLHNSYLAAESNPVTLYQLGLVGTRLAPLDIYVETEPLEVRASIATLDEDTDLHSLWGFPTTKRGICTLITSLKILMRELDPSNGTLNDFLHILFELTHYPPFLLAFRHLHQSDFEATLHSNNVRLIAYTFHVLCLQIAPLWVCRTPDKALESSRQLVAWMFSLQPSRTSTDTISQISMQKVTFTPKDDFKPSMSILFPFSYDVNVYSVSASGENKSKELVVSLEKDDDTLATHLGRVLRGGVATQMTSDYYLDFSSAWSKLIHHKAREMVQPTEFDLLLKTTALSEKFRMVSPAQLGACLSNQLPVITLSSAGYVSLYEQEYYACSEKRFFTWNAVQKKEVMTHANPGQYLMQKLEDTIAERKKDQSWEVDAWGEWNKSADWGTPEEAVIVCIDNSASMSDSMPSSWVTMPTANHGQNPSRLTEVKDFFKNFALRTSALQLPTYLGLVTFSGRTQIVTKQEPTPVHLNFEDQVDQIRSLNMTAIYDAIAEASIMLRELKDKHPDLNCRIVLLTDGEDNDSNCRPEDIANRLTVCDIVLDSIVIGTDCTSELFKISRATGGYAFAPKTQQKFFQIFLLETMVDIRTRPDIVQDPCVPPNLWTSFTPKAADMATAYDFPPCRPHPNQDDYFIALADAGRYLSRQASRSASNRAQSVFSAPSRTTSTRSNSTAISGSTVGGVGGARIVLAEIKAMIDNPHQHMDVYVSERAMNFWKVVMEGPPGSPYEKGIFLLYLDIGSDFPLKPPSARFITPMLHPNITKHGRICHPIFDREWTGTTRIYQVLQHIWGILMFLEARDAVDPLSTLKFWTDPAQGKREVKQYVARFASKSRADLRAEIIGSDTSTISSASSQADCDSESISTVKSNGHSSLQRSPIAANSIAPSARASRRSTSSISSYLAAQRAPPPLMTVPGQQETTASRPNSTRAPSVAGSEANTGGRRLSRRASFFNKFKK